MVKPHPTQSQLKKIFDFDPKSGEFTRLITTSSNAKKGDKTKGCLNNYGYYLIRVDGITYKSHRLAYIYIYGDIPENLEIDHIDRDTKNNSIFNLRAVTSQENKFNRNFTHKKNLTGVVFCKKMNKYRSRIKINKKLMSLGYFETQESAHDAYLKAKQKLHIIVDKTFQRLNE